MSAKRTGNETPTAATDVLPKKLPTIILSIIVFNI